MKGARLTAGGLAFLLGATTAVLLGRLVSRVGPSRRPSAHLILVDDVDWLAEYRPSLALAGRRN